MLSELAGVRLAETTSTSFVLDLKKWLQIMQAYEQVGDYDDVLIPYPIAHIVIVLCVSVCLFRAQGGHAYHATMPTDSIKQFHDAILETERMGWEAARSAQQV